LNQARQRRCVVNRVWMAAIARLTFATVSGRKIIACISTLLASFFSSASKTSRFQTLIRYWT
jgi:hypothetical protein